jgi:hypothetical protein
MVCGELASSLRLCPHWRWRRGHLEMPLGRCNGSMSSSNLGSQVTGTLLLLPFASSRANVSFDQVSTNLQRSPADGYAGTDERSFTGPSMVLSCRNSVCSSGHLAILSSVLRNCKSPSGSRPRSIKLRRPRALLEHVSIWSSEIVIIDARVSTEARGSKARDAVCSMRSHRQN